MVTGLGFVQLNSEMEARVKVVNHRARNQDICASIEHLAPVLVDFNGEKTYTEPPNHMYPAGLAIRSTVRLVSYKGRQVLHSQDKYEM